MNVLLTGSTGKIGRAWLRLAAQDDLSLDVSALGGVDEIDLSRADGIARVTDSIADEQPAIVVHAAAMTDVDGCERQPEQAQQVNAIAVDAIARRCAEVGAGLIFYSTDYVFAGKGPAREDDLPAPLSVYGQTKFAAEQAIARAGGEHLIVRINVPLAPPEDGNSFYSFVRAKLLADETLRIVTDQWNNPLDTDRIARWSWEAWQEGTRGVLHLGGGTYASRYDIARIMADHLEADPALIQAVTSADLKQTAPRPARGGLICRRQAELFGSAPDLATILKALPGR